MLNFFGLCKGQKATKIKAGEIGMEVYAADLQKNRDILEFFQANTDEPNPKSDSLKSQIQKDADMKPIQTFSHNPNKLNEISGDRYTFVRTVKKSNYESLRQSLTMKKQQFTDPQFPPSKQSLGKDQRFHKAVHKWVRISELYKQPLFFQLETDPNDAIQGYFYGAGNCYFISALSNLARFPSRIKQILGNIEISKEGIYYAKLFHNGVFKEIIVDDFIPVSVAGTPLFARPPQGSSEVWVMILQKCYAKLFGSYASMTGGLPSEAYYALTGAPTFFNNLSDYKKSLDSIWKTILESYHKDYCVDFGTFSKIDQTKWLKPNHAYTMLGAYEVQNLKLVKLRNPMGRLQWVGRCSDYDLPFWESITEKNKQMIGYLPNKKNDGIFFMLWEDIPTYFTIFQICEYKNNANQLSIRSNFTMKNANMYEIHTSGGQAIVSLIQDAQRGKEVDLKTFKFSKSYLVISRLLVNQKGEQKFEIVKVTARNQFAAHHQRVYLQAGTYIVYAKYKWNDEFDKQASFIVYSEASIKIRQAKQSQYPQFLQKTFLSTLKDFDEFNEPKDSFTYVKRFYGQQSGYGFYAISVKKSIKQKIQVQIDEEKLRESHLVLKKPYKNRGKFRLTLQEGEQAIVIFRSKDTIIPRNLKVPEAIVTVID